MKTIMKTKGIDVLIESSDDGFDRVIAAWKEDKITKEQVYEILCNETTLDEEECLAAAELLSECEEYENKHSRFHVQTNTFYEI